MQMQISALLQQNLLVKREEHQKQPHRNSCFVTDLNAIQNCLTVHPKMVQFTGNRNLH